MPVSGGSLVQDHVALAEIDLCGELMIAASAADEERLSADRIDEVLRVRAVRADRAGKAERPAVAHDTGPVGADDTEPLRADGTGPAEVDHTARYARKDPRSGAGPGPVSA